MNYSSIRAKKVVNAFINCVINGAMNEEYAICLIEDNQKYGYLTETDKENFYNALPDEEPVEEVIEEPEVVEE